MSRPLLHTAVLALLLNGTAQAAPPVAFRLEGAGTESCAAFAAGFDGTTPEAMRLTTGRLQWLYGYLSAWNVSNPHRLKARYGLFGNDRQHADNFAGWWLLDACRLNPKASLQDIAAGFIAFLLRQEAKP
jgi:hypothetical protein